MFDAIGMANLGNLGAGQKLVLINRYPQRCGIDPMRVIRRGKQPRHIDFGTGNALEHDPCHGG